MINLHVPGAEWKLEVMSEYEHRTIRFRENIQERNAWNREGLEGLAFPRFGQLSTHLVPDQIQEIETRNWIDQQLCIALTILVVAD
jgi:hypothetical protein